VATEDEGWKVQTETKAENKYCAASQWPMHDGEVVILSEEIHAFTTAENNNISNTRTVQIRVQQLHQ